MSAGYQRELEIAHDEATKFFRECATPIPLAARPAGDDDDDQRLALVKEARRKLRYRLDTATELHLQLLNPYTKWGDLRQKMTGTERAEDNPLHADFLRKCDVIDSMARMRALLRKLKYDLGPIDEEYAKLNDGADTPVATAAPNPLDVSFLVTQLQAANLGGGVAPSNSNRDHIELPQIQLPTFDGNVLEWQDFWEAFSSIIGASDLPDSHKLIYLRRHLRNRALNSIAGLPISAAAYREAVTKLESEFGRPQVIKEALLNALNTLKETDGKLESLRSFVDGADAILIQLEKQGESTNTLYVRSAIEQRLPSYLLEKILAAKRNAGELWNTDSLMRKLRDALHDKEDITRIRASGNPGHDNGRSQPSPRSSRFKPTTAPAPQPPPPHNPYTLTFATQVSPPIFQAQATSQPYNKPRQPCRMCHGDHAPSRCRKYPTMTNRLARFAEMGCCHRCGSTLHNGNACPKPLICNRCNDHAHPHMRIFCPLELSAMAQQLSTNSPPQRNFSPQHKWADAPQQQPPRQVHFASPPTPMQFIQGVTHQPNSQRKPTQQVLARPNATGANTEPVNHASQQNTTAQNTSHHVNGNPNMNFSLGRDISSYFQQQQTAQPTNSNKFTTVTSNAPVNNDNVSHHSVDNKQLTFLKVLRVPAFNPRSPSIATTLHVLLDDGSTSTLLTNEAATKLQLDTANSSPLVMGSCGSHELRRHDSSRVKLGLSLVNGSSMIVDADTIDVISRPLPYVKDWPRFLADELELPIDSHPPDLLVGSDIYNELEITLLQRLGSSLHLGTCSLGYFITGPAMFQTPSPAPRPISILSALVHRPATTPMAELHQAVDDFLALETIGIETPAEEKSEEQVHENFIKSVYYDHDEQRYAAGLPWRSPMPDLPTNRQYSHGRLRSLLKRLRQRPWVLKKYHENYCSQREERIIEKVENPAIAAGPVHYLSHLEVVREDKGKVRNVHDASARPRRGDASLNDCLFRGPLLLADLVGVLLRSRLHHCLVLADIQAAFLQVLLRPEDRDATRFLWVEDPEQPPVPPNLVEYRFRRLAFGLTSSPYILAAIIHYHAEHHPSKYNSDLLRDLYVDNVMFGVSTEAEARIRVDFAIPFFQGAGMKLREFATNVPRAVEHLPPELREDKTVVKILGIKWNVATDRLVFSFPDLPPPEELTKKNILSTIAKLYDPLGLLAPVTLAIKLLLQQCWEKNRGWNESVDDSIRRSWNVLTAEWPSTTLNIPRAIADRPKAITVHACSDASQFAVAAAVYLRIEAISGSVSTPLVFSKTRTKPANRDKALRLTIPKMELTGVVLALRACGLVRNQLAEYPLEPTSHLWTDSDIVLRQLVSKKPREMFVSNRLKELRQRDHDLIVRYIATADNPADVASRGVVVGKLKDFPPWFLGPEWLALDESQWPSRTDIPTYRSGQDLEPDSDDDEEGCYTNVLHTTTTSTPVQLFPIDKNTTLSRLLNITAFVLRFVKNGSRGLGRDLKIVERSPTVVARLAPSVHELQLAQLVQIKLAQWQFPPADRENADLKIHLDHDGVLRSDDRVFKSGKANGALIYLPPHSDLARLIVLRIHLELLHAGPSVTLARVRKTFWLPQGRRRVAHYISQDCAICREYRLQPFRWRPTPKLPAFRTALTPPFLHCGIDYFGPMNVWLAKGQVVKSWGAIFVCLVTRAVHLELVGDMTAASFLDAFQRFSSRRCMPTLVLSDNGTNFVAARPAISAAYADVEWDQRWRETIQSDLVQSYARERGVKWLLVVERAPWRGGSYERLIALIKSHLRRCLRRLRLSPNQLYTLLTRVERVVNSRPITFTSDRIDEPTPLTPSHFLNPLVPGLDEPLFPLEIEDDDDYQPHPSTSAVLEEIWRKMLKSLHEFFLGFERDYLASLRERQRAISPRTGLLRTPRVGEIVLVYHDQTPRSQWQHALITALCPSADGEIRTAEIKLPSGHRARRSVTHLYPLETTDEEGETGTDKEPSLVGANNGLAARNENSATSAGEPPLLPAPQRGMVLRSGRIKGVEPR